MAETQPVFVNDSVLLNTLDIGIVRFIGRVTGKEDCFYGIELSSGKGKNTGSYKKIPYFSVKDPGVKSGLFVKRERIKQIISSKKSVPCTFGDRVYVKRKKCHGQVVFIGTPPHEKQVRFGIILEKSNGDTNGMYKDSIQYFETKRRYGCFCSQKDITSDTMKSAKRIISSRLGRKHPFFHSNDEDEDQDDEEKKEETESDQDAEPAANVQCGDTVELKNGAVGIVKIIHSSFDLILDIIWPYESESDGPSTATCEYHEITQLRSMEASVARDLRYEDALYCENFDSYAVVTKVSLLEDMDIELEMDLIPVEIMREFPTLSAAQRIPFGFIGQKIVSKSIKMSELKYRKLNAESYYNEIKNVSLKYQLEQWQAQNSWIHGAAVSVEPVQSNDVKGYDIRFTDGECSMRLATAIPIYDVVKWKVSVKHVEEAVVFLGIIQYDENPDRYHIKNNRNNYDAYCNTFKVEEVIARYSYGKPIYGPSYKLYPFQNIYGLFSTDLQYDGNSERYFWDNGPRYEADQYTLHHDMQSEDEYIFEYNHEFKTLSISVNGKLVRYKDNEYSFKLEKLSEPSVYIFPFISFKTTANNNNQNLLSFAFC